MSMFKSHGHLLLAGIFISGGTNTFMSPESRAIKVAKAGIPNPKGAAMLNGATMVVAGTALACDFAPKLAAIILIGTLIPTTFVGHPFWTESDPANRSAQRIHFLKNVSLLGGLLLVLAEK